MKSRLISILTAGALLFTGNIISQEKIDSLAIKKYSKENIEHVDYDSLNFKNYLLKPISKELEENIINSHISMEKEELLIPDKNMDYFLHEAGIVGDYNFSKKYLNDKYMSFPKEYKDHKKFKKFNKGLTRLLKNNLESLGIPLNKLSIKESLDLVFKTTKNMLDYERVDKGEVIVEGVSYNSLPFDRKIKMGVGDCNIFTSLANHLFLNLKNKNKNLENVYLGHSYYSKMNGHDWNQIYFTDGEKLFISSVDLSLDKKKNAIDNSNNFYLSEFKDENLLPFYHTMSKWFSEDVWKKLFLNSNKKTKEYIKNNGLPELFEIRSKRYFWKFQDENSE